MMLRSIQIKHAGCYFLWEINYKIIFNHEHAEDIENKK
jgi:hypothetical protein